MATQIAEALGGARARDHPSDLKPANHTLREDRTVKVLDFGAGKTVDSTSGAAEDAMTSAGSRRARDGGWRHSRTAVMSPEQARVATWTSGRTSGPSGACDADADGRLGLAGKTMSDLLAAVLTTEPDWTTLPEETLALDPQIASAVSGERSEETARLGSRRATEIDDVSQRRRWTHRPDRSISSANGRRDRRYRGRRRRARLVSEALGHVEHEGRGRTGRVSSSRCPSRVETEGVLVISRGRRVAHAAGPAGRQQLFVREIDQFASKAVPETEGVVSAAFAPDGQSIAFVAARKLRIVSLSGGTHLTLRDRVDGAGVNWTADQSILYNPGTATGIWRVPTAGGEAVRVTQPGPKDNEQRFPEVLPNGKGLLFSALSGVTDDQIYVESLRTHERHALVKGFAPHYLPTGHLVSCRGNAVRLRFDAETFEMKGASDIARGIRQGALGQPLISYSDVGSIVYLPTSAPPGSMRLSGWTAPATSSRPAHRAALRAAAPSRPTDGVWSHHCAATPRICG
jgi:hypothetical protein